MRSIAIALGIAWLIVASSNHSAAESEDLFCAEMFPACDFGWHVLQGPSPGGYSGSEAHGDCRLCVEEFPCHTGCDALIGNPDVQASYDAVLAATDRGDVAAVLRLAKDGNGFARFNQSRGSVQIMSCDQRRIIANLNVAD
jgi:hypothetical protein